MGTLQEELKRFNAINKYTEKLLSEQEPPIDPNALPPAAPPTGAKEVPADAGIPPATDPNAPVSPEKDAATAGDEASPSDEVTDDTTSDDTTEEIDITDLVNMTKSIKKQLDDTQGQDNGATQKMDDVFAKLGELENKLGEMDSVLAKIDQLGAQIQQVKPKTPIEKLEMRSLDSYPFNKKPDEFFSEKQDEMKKAGKNEYVLTKDEVENYGKNQIMKSFNPNAEENPYNY